jgi:ATP-dependent DNA helicase RecG
MQSYSDAELAGLARDPESELVERKESLHGDASKNIREAICAFANDLPGYGRPGVVFVGLRDDGRPSGLPITDQLRLSLAAMKDDGNIVPPPSLGVRTIALDGADIAAMIVLPSDTPPVSYQSRIWVRSGPRRSIATAQEERILNARRRSGDRPFDVRPVRGATLSDLDRARFEYEYLPSAVAPDVLAANERTLQERLASKKMVVSADDPVPTVLGLLVLCPHTRDYVPGAYVRFLRVRGKELADPIADDALIEGTVSDVIRRLEEKLDAHNTTSVDFVSGDRERRQSTYPRVELQQLIRNAIMHRTYESTHAPVRVTWFDDRIEIISPGGPFGAVRKENFGRPGVTDYRNPNLAEAMRVLGYVQSFGAGIATARRALQENGNPAPEFEVEPTMVGVKVWSIR